jgi:CBS domain-containing protein/uncharacterized protein (DUF2267 family)
MSLEAYRRPRMIVLSMRSTAYEAARAMVDNHVGAVLVHGGEQPIAGIVTDRDIALEVVAGDLDGRSTPLRDIMSDEIATLDIGASVEDAVRVMREHACRRVPVTEQGKPIGLVTLDDLLAEGEIDAATAGAIVRAQLEVAARFKPAGSIHPEEPARPEMSPGRVRALLRRRARAESAHGRLLHAVERHSGLLRRDSAELALEIVLTSLCRRVTPEEARHLIAQLPSKLHPVLTPRLDGPDKRITRESIEADLARELHLDPAAAETVLTSICEAIADSVSAGEIEGFRGQLPLDMKDLFPPTWLRSA